MTDAVGTTGVLLPNLAFVLSLPVWLGWVYSVCPQSMESIVNLSSATDGTIPFAQINCVISLSSLNSKFYPTYENVSPQIGVTCYLLLWVFFETPHKKKTIYKIQRMMIKLRVIISNLYVSSKNNHFYQFDRPPFWIELW